MQINITETKLLQLVVASERSEDAVIAHRGQAVERLISATGDGPAFRLGIAERTGGRDP